MEQPVTISDLDFLETVLKASGIPRDFWDWAFPTLDFKLECLRVWDEL